MGKPILEKIIRKTGRKPSTCKCQACKNQCRTPCMGTPDDLLRLIEAGYLDQLAVTYWCVGVVLGRLNHPIVMVQATTTNDGWCVFFREGLCELHDKQLKPTEGCLSHHSITEENYTFSRGLAYQVAKEWLDEANLPVIEKVFGHFGVAVQQVRD